MSVTTEDLEKFVVKCQPKLDAIKTSLNAFNIFNVLGVQHREIRHSNFLGWLFDPNESHQLGDIFVKDLFKLLRQVEVLNPEQFIHLLLSDLSETQVFRETVHNIDILIVNEELGFVICIENKIYAGYSDEQLGKYHKYVEEHYESLPNRIYLTLTPKPTYHHNDFTLGGNYTNINYQNIISLIKQNREFIDTTIPTVRESINQYIAMVEKDIVKNSKEVILAREIYKKYKDEINFIIRNQQDFEIFRNEMIGFIKDGGLKGFKMTHPPHHNVIHILPDDNQLLELFHHPKAQSWGGDYIFSLIFFFEQTHVWMKFGFGNIIESTEKESLAKLKARLYNDMYDFEVFEKPIESKFHFQMHPKKPRNEYAGIAGIRLFDDEEFAMSDENFKTFFMEKFEIVNAMLIKPWIEECLATLSSIPHNSINLNENN